LDMFHVSALFSGWSSGGTTFKKIASLLNRHAYILLNLDSYLYVGEVWLAICQLAKYNIKCIKM
jgi:hypothetical protein